MPSAKYKDTRTDEARDSITSAVEFLIQSEQAVATALTDRNQALRDAYASGVEHRDLVELLRDAGVFMSRQQVARIVRGARNQVTT